MHPVEYLGRKIHAAERNNTRYEREALEVDFARRKFSVDLLLLKQLQLIIDHEAPQYALIRSIFTGYWLDWWIFGQIQIHHEV